MSLRSLLVFLLLLGAVRTALAEDQRETRSPQIIPWPRTLTQKQGFLSLTGHSHIVAKSRELEPLASILSEEIFQVIGIRLTPGAKERSAGDVVLALEPALKGESYTLNVDRSARVQGGNYNSVAAGTVTLLQSLRVMKGVLTLPFLRINDEPAYAYRGALIDLGRKYHSPGGIRQVIELCQLYKIRFLHLHLTDDQLFMFPSMHFPQAGKSNQEFARFEPGSKPHIEPYTIQELKQLEQFARERGVFLVPEIDLPGHSGRLIADAHDLFGIPGNGSTVNIASPGTLAALTVLLNEVMDVFQSTPYIHLGADEVGLDGLDQTDDYREAQAKYGIKSVHDLYCKFVADMHNVITKRGKKTLVWEEACNSDGPYPLPKDALVMVWSQGRSPNELVKQGYEVVNATWTPLYIVRDNKKSLEFLFDWAVPKFGREGSTEYTPLAETANLKGAQLCSWENSEAIEIQSMRDRLALVSERVWNPQAAGSLLGFKSRLAHTDAILEKLIHPITIQAQSKFVRDENTFTTPLTLTLTPRRSGLTLKYTFDNSLPNAAWQTYTGPMTLDRTVHLRAGLFDRQGAQQGDLVGSWFRSEIPLKPNLATNRPVTVGPSPDRADAWSAKVAVDGRSDDAGRHWASEGAAPQWLQVDLGKVVPINFINVITYWDGSRYYQWNAEVSIDGQDWKKTLDFSQNTMPATAKGYSGMFATTEARYVRINMLKNSANPYVHIVELIVDRIEKRMTTQKQPVSTDWFQKSGYGVFMHFLPGSAEDLKKVEKFDVEALASQLQEMGAKYFVLTLGQNSGYFVSPNAAYDKMTGYKAGERCSKRDLPLDLSNALKRKGIRLMLYLPAQTPNRDRQAQAAFGLPEGPADQPIDTVFAAKWAQVIQEWADRYRDKVSGWWFDGCYRHVHFNDAIAEIYNHAVKHGNPKSITAFNPGIELIHYSAFEDYTAGETNEPLGLVPSARFVEGSQWHVLTFAGSSWGQRDTRYTGEQWAEWVQKVVAQGGVVTLDMGPNYDEAAGAIGMVSAEQKAQGIAIKQAVRQREHGEKKP